MKKILIVATLDSHIKAFHQPIIADLIENNWVVDVASNGNDKFEGVRNKYNISIYRSPFNLKNLRGLIQLKKIIKENQYDIIHSHTPMGGVLGRLANNNKLSKSIYTAHGFHFYKGAPLINWVLYYSIEKILSKRTDLLITINEEDYQISKSKFNNTHVMKINGVGIDFEKYNKVNDNQYLKKEFNILESDFVIASIGELNNNKNQMYALKSIKELVADKPNLKYLLVGEGKNKNKYTKYIKRNKLTKNIFLTGYRKDIPEILSITNLVVSLSKREGLPLNIIEAMFMKKIVLASSIRGHVDLIEHDRNGFLWDLKNRDSFIFLLKEIINNYSSYNELKNAALIKAMDYEINKINEIILRKYDEVMLNE